MANMYNNDTGPIEQAAMVHRETMAKCEQCFQRLIELNHRLIAAGGVTYEPERHGEIVRAFHAGGPGESVSVGVCQASERAPHDASLGAEIDKAYADWRKVAQQTVATKTEFERAMHTWKRKLLGETE